MTKLLLNTGLTPLYTAEGAPIPSGGVVLDDELDAEHTALYDDGTLVYVRPHDVDPEAKNVSDLAREHVIERAAERKREHDKAKRGNTAPAVSEDAGVTKTPDEGGKS